VGFGLFNFGLSFWLGMRGTGETFVVGWRIEEWMEYVTS